MRVLTIIIGIITISNTYLYAAEAGMPQLDQPIGHLKLSG